MEPVSMDSALAFFADPYLNRNTYIPPELRELLGVTSYSPTVWNGLSADEIRHLDYQDSSSIAKARALGDAHVNYQLVDLDNLHNFEFPAMFARIFWHMCFLDCCDHARGPHDRFVFISRQELISPTEDMRRGLIMHQDEDLFLPNGAYAGRIQRAWNCYNRIPTMGYYGNTTGVEISDIKEQITLQMMALEGDGANERIYDYMGKIGGTFRLYGENSIVGFHGGDKGWLHMAQPTIEAHYIKQDDTPFVLELKKHMDGTYLRLGHPTYSPIDRPFLRNTATMIVVSAPS